MRVLLLLLLACGLLTSCADPGPPPGGTIAKFEAIDEKVGDGAVAKAGQDVVVHYTGWNYDEKAPDKRGAKFDSSRDRNEPFTFLLGAGRVIRGWDEGVAGMRVGGHRVLMIPPEYGYGRRGAGGVIPPNGSLVFEVELLDVREH
ncbi:FKBP-type peptidyl-prolyl cis-trans isomerase [Lysobacter niastensis]|uniref:Peptidyl-prolyl cis-trans isomerase n=1 Tax=Lysobacter niastensis TaxID=380629 RepID=A0ABS0BAG8_9GAMM|nr:FKBP-type peptidyl-prolyl cis-trans isomerase [Lysobacter niastensis]MBF6024642.1 FKBP-type peptidyl-prolyl cis-trans isomerase [Lysobacter niastensis]